ncbi:MAG: ABC transporter substrate-binding protein [Candidatus Binatia bacterium]
MFRNRLTLSPPPKSRKLLLLVLAVLMVTEAAEAQGPTKIVIGYSAVQAPIAPLWIAQDLGFFSKYGLETKLVFVRTTSVHIAGLVSGSIDMSYGGGSGVLSVAGSGVDLRFVASFASRLSHVLVTRPEIQQPKDLQGKRIGVVSIGGTQWITTKLGLEYLGLDEQGERIQLLAIGDQSVLRGALEAGNIDAAFFNGAMAEELRSKGFRILVDLHKANIRTLGSGIIAKKATLQKNPELATNVVKATFEGLAFVKSAAGKPVVVKALMQRLKISDAAVAEQGYYYLQRDLDTQVSPPVEGLRNLQRFMKTYNPRVGEVNVTDLVDTSVVKHLSDTGFIDKISRSYDLK